VLPVSHRIPPTGARIGARVCRQRGPRPVRWRRWERRCVARPPIARSPRWCAGERQKNRRWQSVAS